MSYEAWRITFQSSEQAARAAYEIATKNKRDAARYQWLSENNGVRNHHGVEIYIDGEAHAPGHLDAQVDDAMCITGANDQVQPNREAVSAAPNC